MSGHQGWFPAKLVEVLDERSKEYSFAGDDSVTQAITDIVRGVLCPSIKRIFEHGLRRYSIFILNISFSIDRISNWRTKYAQFSPYSYKIFEKCTDPINVMQIL